MGVDGPRFNQISSSTTYHNLQPRHPREILKRYVFRPIITQTLWKEAVNLGQDGQKKPHPLPFEDQEPTAGNYFYVEKKRELHPRYFEIIGSHLVMRASPATPVLNYLNLTHFQLRQGSWTTKEGRTIHLLHFTNNIHRDYLATKCSRIMWKWFHLMSKYCIGAAFEDMYTLQQLLGKGEYGVVRLVERKNDTNLLSQRAVKIFDKKKISIKDYNDVERKSIVNEVEFLRMLNHPMIIKLFEVYENKDFVFIVTEFYNGKSLMDRIEKTGTKHMSLVDCLEITKRILVALEYLHAMKIIHRDIKPDNIVFKDSDGSYDLVLIDFGFAAYQDRYDKLFKVCGTLGYVAPEVISFQPYDTKADLFSVGAILYVMLTKKNPFLGGKGVPEDIIKQRIVECSVDFCWRNHGIQMHPESEELITQFIKKLLERIPSKRLSAREALEHPVFSILKRQDPDLQVLKEVVPQKPQLERLRENALRIRPTEITSDEKLEHDEILPDELEQDDLALTDRDGPMQFLGNHQIVSSIPQSESKTAGLSSSGNEQIEVPMYEFQDDEIDKEDLNL